MTNLKLKKAVLTKGANAPKEITSLELDALQKAAAKVEQLEKSIEDNKALLATQTAENATLTKSLTDANAKVEAIALEKAEVAKTNMTEIVKGFTFVGDDEQEQTIESLLKSKDSVLLTQLSKAQDIINSFATSENGTDKVGGEELTKAESANQEFDAIAAQIMKSRNKGNK